MVMEENILAEQSREGNEDAYGALVKKYKTKVFNLAYSFTRDRATADDLAQEVFIKAYYSLGKFRFKSGFGTWLYRLAVNHFKDYLRKQKKVKYIPFQDFREEAKFSEEEKRRNAQSQEKQQKVKLIRQVLRTLPDKYQIILTLRDIQGHSYEEIAQILKLSPGTVDSRLHRARKLLKKKVAHIFSREGGKK
jgi:RNA polymerase sigma-70 factor (ECF subfamily)